MRETLKKILDDYKVNYDESIESIYDDDINTLLDNIEDIDENITKVTDTKTTGFGETDSDLVAREINGLAARKNECIRNLISLLNKR